MPSVSSAWILAGSPLATGGASARWDSALRVCSTVHHCNVVVGSSWTQSHSAREMGSRPFGPAHSSRWVRYRAVCPTALRMPSRWASEPRCSKSVLRKRPSGKAVPVAVSAEEVTVIMIGRWRLG